jgi:DNA-binding transcriptional ArsR family regulator
MVAAANLVEVAARVGDTARATMLNALMGGQALTATELAYCASVSRSTASGHLSKLVAARLLTITRSRRFSYYRIASRWSRQCWRACGGPRHHRGTANE